MGNPGTKPGDRREVLSCFSSHESKLQETFRLSQVSVGARGGSEFFEDIELPNGN